MPAFFAGGSSFVLPEHTKLFQLTEDGFAIEFFEREDKTDFQTGFQLTSDTGPGEYSLGE